MYVYVHVYHTWYTKPFTLHVPLACDEHVLSAEPDWDDDGLPLFTLQGIFFGACVVHGPAQLRIDVVVEDYDPDRRAELGVILHSGQYDRQGRFRIQPAQIQNAVVRDMCNFV